MAWRLDKGSLGGCQSFPISSRHDGSGLAAWLPRAIEFRLVDRPEQFVEPMILFDPVDTMQRLAHDCQLALRQQAYRDDRLRMYHGTLPTLSN